VRACAGERFEVGRRLQNGVRVREKGEGSRPGGDQRKRSIVNTSPHAGIDTKD
jgi:hypothetical protein